MPHPIEDPFRAAARHAIDGDFKQVFNAVRDVWIERCLDGFEPSDDADEDGPYSNPQRDFESRAASCIDGNIEFEIGDAIYELLLDELGEDAAMQHAQELEPQIKAELERHVAEVADEAYDSWSDGVAYSRDPYAYHGVSRRDFF